MQCSSGMPQSHPCAVFMDSPRGIEPLHSACASAARQGSVAVSCCFKSLMRHRSRVILFCGKERRRRHRREASAQRAPRRNRERPAGEARSKQASGSAACDVEAAGGSGAPRGPVTRPRNKTPRDRSVKALQSHRQVTARKKTAACLNPARPPLSPISCADSRSRSASSRSAAPVASRGSGRRRFPASP